MRLKSMLLCLGLGLVLAACQTTTQPTVGVSDQPGPDPVTATQAARAFERACYANAPDFRGTYAQLASTRNYNVGSTGLYYHKKLNLSFLVHDLQGYKVCSMVFFPDETFEVATGKILTYFAKKSGAAGRIQRFKTAIGGVAFHPNPSKSVIIDSRDDSPVMRMMVRTKLN